MLDLQINVPCQMRKRLHATVTTIKAGNLMIIWLFRANYRISNGIGRLIFMAIRFPEIL